MATMPYILLLMILPTLFSRVGTLNMSSKTPMKFVASSAKSTCQVALAKKDTNLSSNVALSNPASDVAVVIHVEVIIMVMTSADTTPSPRLLRSIIRKKQWFLLARAREKVRRSWT